MDLQVAFPKKMTVLTVALTLAIILGLGAQLGNLLQYITVLKDKHIPSAELSGMIVHVDDMLTSTTYLGLLTGQEKWTEKYRQYEPAIEYSTRRFTSLLADTVPAEELRALREARKDLFELEARALDLGKRGKLVDAFALLDGPAYQARKQAYTKTIYDITGRLGKTRNDALDRHHLVARFTFIGFLVSLAVLVVTGVLLTRLLMDAERQRRKMMTQLARASKLASLGTLSSGLAHELRSPLTVIKGLAQCIELDEKVTPELKGQARHIVEESERIEAVTTRLRSFAREGGAGEWKPVSLNETVTQSLALLREQLKNRGIEVRLSLAEDLPVIWGQKGQLESVIHNLATNSRDAFETNSRSGNKIIEIRTYRNDRGGASVRFKDTAGGMPPEVKESIFDPFFTTKEGRGLGLGLSIVHSIVEEHKGVLEVETELNHHTTFLLEFPPHRDDTRSEAAPRAAA